MSAFAPLVHEKSLDVENVSPLSEVTTAFLGRATRHDIAWRYRFKKQAQQVGVEADTGAAVMTVIPPTPHALAQRSERYLPAHALAHASGRYITAITDEARRVKEEQKSAAEAAAMNSAAATGDSTPARAPRSNSQRSSYRDVIDAAYIRAEPVHLIVLNSFCDAHDSQGTGAWRASGSNPMLPSHRSSDHYTWAAPLFSTFRLTSAAPNLCLAEGTPDPGLSPFAHNLFNQLSITTVNLPLVPPASSLHRVDDWLRLATLPAHKEALRSDALRQWLVYLAHTTVDGERVCLPAELAGVDNIRKSAWRVERKVKCPRALSPEETAELVASVETATAARVEAERKLQAIVQETEQLNQEAERVKQETERLRQERDRLRAGRPSGSV